MGEYLRAEDWFAAMGDGCSEGWRGGWERREEVKEEIEGSRGWVMAEPKGAKEEGVNGTGVN